MTIPDPKFAEGDKVQFVFYESDHYPPVSHTFCGIIQMVHTYNHLLQDYTYCVKITRRNWRRVFEDRYPEITEGELRYRIKTHRKPVKKVVVT